MGRVSNHVRSNAIGYVALFVALCGTAYAVDGPLPGQNQVGSGDIIDGEVRTEDIRDNNLTTADIKPNAVTAGKVLDETLTGADIVDSTVNAGQVDGIDAAVIDEQTMGAELPVEILNMGGLILRLECVDTDFFEPKLVAATTVDDAMIRSRAFPDFQTVDGQTDDDFDTGAADEKTIYDTEQGAGLINYRSPTGSDVTVQYMIDGSQTIGGCTASGTALRGQG
jgi:hypothetical protein